MPKADVALLDLVSWSDRSEVDFYYYVKEFFRHVLGYPKENILLTETGSSGGIPDVSLVAKDVRPKDKVFWIVGEVKRKPGLFRDQKVRRNRWEVQLRKYVTSDTIYTILLDPSTLVVLKPTGEEVAVIALDEITASDLVSSSATSGISFLEFENSVSDRTLAEFKNGRSPSRFIDVRTDEGRDEFYRTLHVCSRELISYSLARVRALYADYSRYKVESAELESRATGDAASDKIEDELRKKHQQSRTFVEQYLEEFRKQIGKALPKRKEAELDYLLEVYATEGSSLLLARILFVRFSEDHGMTTRKISNGGIKRYREFYESVKDDYRNLLVNAFKDLERIYARLFEPSVFDWAHEGNGELSNLLLRIFYRLNAFEFTQIDGDLLGNLYERFLPVEKRKKLGEYYTPLPIADYVLEKIGFFERPGPLLDPACGSGTFLIAAADGLVRRMVARGVEPAVAVDEALKLVNGIDINMFAAFIAQLQLIWHLFPYVKKAGRGSVTLPEIRVFGGLSALVWLQHSLSDTLLKDYADKSQSVRDGVYRYVVGNPPYIRNERLKDRGPWRAFFSDVDHNNSDISFFFVQRALIGGRRHNSKGPDTTKRPWLEEGGRMCFVLPHGICDSEAAHPLRDAFFERRVLEVTDLEEVAQELFPSPQASSRATTAPILLFVENSHPSEDVEMEIVQVPRSALSTKRLDAGALSSSSVRQAESMSPKINPDAQILTKLQARDMPILRKIRQHMTVGDFAAPSSPAYGVKVGREGHLSPVPGDGLMPLRKGANVSTYRLDPKVSRWLKLKRAESKSIWAHVEKFESPAYALSGISFAPQCAVFDPNTTCLNDSSRIFVPSDSSKDFPWDVLINSSTARFTYLLTLRAGLVGVGTPVGEGRTASWCCLYPRSIALLPAPEELVKEPERLTGLAKAIRALAEEVGSRWSSVDAQLELGPKRGIALFDVDFSNWIGPTPAGAEVSVTRTGDRARLALLADKQLTLSYIEGRYDVLNVVRYLLERQDEPGQDVRTLELPENVETISAMVDQAKDPDSAPMRRFKELQVECNRVIAEGFGLTVEEQEYITQRLAAPPLDVLQPRWPWTPVEIRDIQEYDSDRFA
jgi:type I restriction-modification system DNA methylase subunit